LCNARSEMGVLRIAADLRVFSKFNDSGPPVCIKASQAVWIKALHLVLKESPESGVRSPKSGNAAHFDSRPRTPDFGLFWVEES
jgi:hypothetical protein